MSPAALRHFDAAAERYARLRVFDEPSLLALLRRRPSCPCACSTRPGPVARRPSTHTATRKRDVHLPDALLMMSTVALPPGGPPHGGVHRPRGGGRRLPKVGSREVCSPWPASLRSRRRSGDRPDGDECRPRRPGPPTTSRLTGLGRAGPRSGGCWPVGSALRQGRSVTARDHLARASKARSVGPADARARAWLAEALLRRADGRRAAAHVLRSAPGCGSSRTTRQRSARPSSGAHVGVPLGRAGDVRSADGHRGRRRPGTRCGGPSEGLRHRAAAPAGPAVERSAAPPRTWPTSGSTMAEIEEARTEGETEKRKQKLVRRQVASGAPGPGPVLAPRGGTAAAAGSRWGR